MTTLEIQPGFRFLIVRPIPVVEPAGDDVEASGAAAGAGEPNTRESNAGGPNVEDAPPAFAALAVTVVERAKWVVDHWSCVADDGRKLIVHPDDFLRPLPPAW